MNGGPPRIGINFLAEEGCRAAALPLFEEGAIDAIEWAIDTRWGLGDARNEIPAWAEEVLDLYAEEDALYGHGVWFSFLNARLEPRQERWLAQLADECKRRHYRHVTEHFGWMHGTLLPAPRTEGAVAVGIDRLQRLAAATGGPVGLENLAASLNRADAEEQGEFLDAILAPGDHLLILDVHNVWTQAVNLGLDAEALLETYPLDRVREVHVSGGAWYRARGRSVRTDSHDGPVPDAVPPLLARALALCPNVEVVFLERRGQTLDSEDDRVRWRDDFRAMRAIVEEACRA